MILSAYLKWVNFFTYSIRNVSVPSAFNRIIRCVQKKKRKEQKTQKQRKTRERDNNDPNGNIYIFFYYCIKQFRKIRYMERVQLLTTPNYRYYIFHRLIPSNLKRVRELLEFNFMNFYACIQNELLVWKIKKRNHLRINRIQWSSSVCVSVWNETKMVKHLNPKCNNKKTKNDLLKMWCVNL